MDGVSRHGRPEHARAVAVGAGVHAHRRHLINAVVTKRLWHVVDQGADVVDVRRWDSRWAAGKVDNGLLR